jgi:5'-deoxynucleotidase YfbR-like HD superfamily hydrolase
MHIEIDFSEFPLSREEKLKQIYRFHMFEKFYYRANIWMHTHRVLWLLESVLPVVRKHLSIDEEKARVLALVHDDTEIITGDIPSAEKAKLSGDKLKQLNDVEEKAAEELAKTYPQTIHGYYYKELLLNALRKDCPEAQIVSYLDKIDAQCESVHEVFAGNLSLLHSVMYYSVNLSMFPKKFPDLISLFEDPASPITYMHYINFPHRDAEKKYFDFLNKPHTSELVKKETLLPFYNEWKKIVMEKEDGMAWLTEQKEF